ncbi:hypothetical protein BTVI_109716 [Pitangus sulphuratus]|nr:hypothetical protein BTVI_109716 [Pitangus sulphuratus]
MLWREDHVKGFTEVQSSRTSPKCRDFHTDDGLRGSQCPELEDHDCKNDQLPVEPKIVQDLLLQLDPTNLWDLMGFITESSKSWLVSSQNLLQ